MKKETILKTIVILMVGVILIAMPINVFADNTTDLNDFFNTTNTTDDSEYENQGSKSDLTGNTNTNTNTNNTNTNNTNTNTTNTDTATTNKNTNIPKAGLAENTMAGVAITLLGIIAIYAYKKVNEYKNI